MHVVHLICGSEGRDRFVFGTQRCVHDGGRIGRHVMLTFACPQHRERFLDHYRFDQEDIQELFAMAQRERAECLVTTEKDAVRISETLLCPLPLYYLRLEIDILRGAADFDEAVGRICFPQSG